MGERDALNPDPWPWPAKLLLGLVLAGVAMTLIHPIALMRYQARMALLTHQMEAVRLPTPAVGIAADWRRRAAAWPATAP